MACRSVRICDPPAVQAGWPTSSPRGAQQRATGAVMPAGDALLESATFAGLRPQHAACRPAGACQGRGEVPGWPLAAMGNGGAGRVAPAVLAA